MKLLLHSCCGPCTIYPYKVLKEQHHEITSIFHNPNIHPFREFKARLRCFREYCEKINIPAFIDNNYGLHTFLRNSFSSKIDRCFQCYSMRLTEVAKTASEKGFEGFTTTLLYSKYQQHKVIHSICTQLAEQFSLSFVYEDFRKGWQYGIDKSIEENMYRQSYCGCIFSEQERYDKKFHKSKNSIVDTQTNRYYYAHNAGHRDFKSK